MKILYYGFYFLHLTWGIRLLIFSMVKRRSVLVVIILLVFSSCASIFNRPTTKLRIYTSKPVVVKAEGKVQTKIADNHGFRVNRNPEPLQLSVFASDSIQRRVSVDSKNSAAFYLNFFPMHYFIQPIVGVLLDRKNPKRFTYPRVIYIDLSDTTGGYLNYIPLDSANSFKKNLLKLSITKPFSYDPGGVEISYERIATNRSSYQFTYTHISSTLSRRLSYFNPSNLKGRQFELEYRYYLKKSAPLGYYLSGELTYLSSEHYDQENLAATNRYYSLIYVDNIGVTKNNFSFNIKLGRQFFVDRLSIDAFVGVGLRFKNVKHFDGLNPDGRVLNSSYFLSPDIDYMNNRSGRYVSCSVPLGLKIGYLF